MKVLSVNISLPEEITYKGQTFYTAIRKKPQTGRVNTAQYKLEGDGVGGPKVHGGEYMAIYGYAIEDYQFWKNTEPKLSIEYPMFGENLTTEGLDYSQLCIGDILKFGDVTLMATLPRLPCKNLAMIVDDPMFIKKFLFEERMGTYFRIVEAGSIGSGDSIEILEKDPHGLRIYDLVAVRRKDASIESVKDHLNHPKMSPAWREMFLQRYS